MKQKAISGDCINCESTYGVSYYKEMVSDDEPLYCPFCGESIEDVTEEYIEDDNYEEEQDWNED